MKKTIIFLGLLMLYSTLQAEQHLCLSEALPGETSRYFSATDHILLLPGFQAEPSGTHYVKILIDPYDATPPMNDMYGGPEPGDNGVVGSVKGSIDVSALGAATYTIPLKLPSGLGGLAPGIFIYYNNQRRNGLLGWNWDLGGLSSITRTGGTIYHDGYNSAVNYSTDRFCLDGQRLLKVSNGNYGANDIVYHTEIDQMSKIVSYNEPGYKGPSYFKVWAADGKIYSYGTSDDTKALVDSEGHVTYWLLKSIEDRYGNTIRYHYMKQSNSYYISRIDYSGNESQKIDDSYHVQFLYESRDDIEICANGSFLQTEDLLLNSIIVYNNNDPMYTYSFQYQEPNTQTGYPYNLLTSIGFSADNKHVNPTRIIWGNNNYGIPSLNSTSVSVTTNSISAAFSHAVKFSGDFNGDGYTDVIATSLDVNENTYKKAYLFINRGGTNELEFDLARTFDLSPETNWIYTGDVDGNGFDDILFTTRSPFIPNYLDKVQSTVFLTKINANSELTFYSHTLPELHISSNYLESLVLGDFLGEGKLSILVQTLESNDKSQEESVLIRYDEDNGTFQDIHFNDHLSSTQLYPGDYDGDGSIELLYKDTSNNTKIAKLRKNSGSPYFQITVQASVPNWTDCFPGDYNGDGATDVLFYRPSENQKWAIRLSTHSGLDSREFHLSSSFPYQTLEDYHYSLLNLAETDHFITVGDFDGNGCADLILREDVNNVHVYYGPLNPESESAPFAYHRKINTQYFHYFNNRVICVGNFLGEDRMTFLGNYTLSYLPSINLSHEVKSIKDGMGQITDLSYDYLMPNPKNPSESDFYRLNYLYASTIDKINTVPIPIRALKKITTYNVSNKPVSTACQYEGALFHKQGKGFLGFTITRQKEYCNNQLQKTTARHYECQPYDPVIHMGMIQEEVFDPDGTLMAKTEYTNYYYLNKNNKKVYVPVFYKYSYEYDIDHPENLIKKEISEVIIETEQVNVLEYDNILSIVQTIQGTTDNPAFQLASSCEYQTKTITTYMPNNSNQWLINRPKTITRIDHRNGNYADICHQLIYSYNASKPFQASSITAIPNDGSNANDRLTKKTVFQYDDTGNLISKTVSAPNDPNTPPRTESYVYSAEYGKRLMTAFIDAAGNTTQYKYDPVYNYCVSMIDYNHFETLYETDPLGITTKSVFSDGTISYQAIRWDGGQYYQWEKKTGTPTKITYFAKTGEPIKKRTYSLNGETVVSRIEYDPYGRVKTEWAPQLEEQLPQMVSYDYDDHNRIRKINHQDGTRETLTYNGRTTSSTFHANDKASQTESKTVNIMGWVVKSTDAEGVSVIYDYNPEGKVIRTQIEGMDETQTLINYDANGNRFLLYDPNYGQSSCEYNIFGELTRQVTPKYDITDYEYDVMGNLTKRTEFCYKSQTSSVTEWQYGQTDGLRGLLLKIKSDNQTISYEYDNKLRLKSILDQCLGKEFKTSYQYDKASRISSLTYPSGYTIHYCYSSEGVVRSIMDDDSKVLWKAGDANSFGMPTWIITGDGLVTQYDYDNISNKLLKIKTLRGDEIIQEYEYQYDDYSNITTRMNKVKNQTEHFSYDPLNRLTATVDQNGESIFTYDALGRMTQKTNAGQPVFSNANYSGDHPHAIKSATASPGTFPQERMDIVYTPFGKVAQIQEGTKQITYQYGYDHQRIQVIENIDGVRREKLYANNFEVIMQPDGTIIKRTLLSCPTGIFAVVEDINGETSLHYIHKDHLGSWTIITDEEGQIEQENWFDAWGNCENPDALLFDRGYTGHEHIHGMNLINMDGRIYDPVTSSMLSPDNYIQMPDFSQNFNRYAYCLNNPLSYSDPDGNNPITFALLAYFIFFTDMGYEFQKYISPIAIHIDLHLAGHQKGIGVDVSVGFEKKNPLSYRMHFGATYYWGYYDDSYQGWEFRVGGEWTVNGIVGFSGTTYYTKGRKQQTTNSIILGNFIGSVSYENDYMFNLAKYLWGIPAADNGDRYRSAAFKARFLIFSAGFNIFTGDPGLKGSSRNTFHDPDAEGRLTYTLNAEGNDPDQYRAGLLYFGIGGFYYGFNSEKIRNFIQNRFAHDWLCRGDSPYFKVLDRPEQSYFYFSSGTGNSLW
jgi:RHS repeat-associated protein